MTLVAEPVFSSKWLVACMHSDGKAEIAQLDQFEDFKPKNAKDLGPFGKKFTLRTKKWNKQQKWERYRVYVGRMAANGKLLEDSLAAHRPKYPPLVIKDSDFLSSESEVEQWNKVPAKLAKKQTENRRRRAEDNDYDDFLKGARLLDINSNESLSHHPMPQSNISNSNSPAILSSKTVNGTTTADVMVAPSSSNSSTAKRFKPSTSDCHNISKVSTFVSRPPSSFQNHSSGQANAFSQPSSQSKFTSNETSSGDGEDSELASVTILLQSILKEQQSLKGMLEAIQQSNNDVSLRMTNLEARMETRMTALEEGLQKLQNASSTGYPAVSSASNMSEPSEASGNKVALSRDVLISPASYRMMQVASNTDDFANALLLGAFGDDAKRYRIFPRMEDNLPFPPQFITVAKSEYAKFLERQGQKPPFERAMLNSILRVLSKKATDLNGRRNKSPLESERASCPSTSNTGQESIGSLCNVEVLEIDVLPERGNSPFRLGKEKLPSSDEDNVSDWADFIDA